MNNIDNMQKYTFVVNIGSQRLSDYLSYTLLMPYIQEKNVYFYFFIQNHDDPLEDKLKEVYINIKNMTLETTNQTFRIIYYNSDFNELLKEQVTEGATNTLWHFTQILQENIKRYVPLVDLFNKFEHLHIFHEPWFNNAVIENHQKIVENKVKPEIEVWNKNNKLNTHFIYRFSQQKDNPRQLAFDLISLRSMKYLSELLSGKVEDFDTCDIKNSICLTEIEDITEQYDAYLPEYKGKLMNYLEFLRNDVPQIDIALYEENVEFWKIEKIDTDDIDSISDEAVKDAICADSSSGCNLDYRVFERRWESVSDRIESSVRALINKMQNKKFEYQPNLEETKRKNPLKDAGNKPERKILEDEIEKYRKLLNEELSKNNDSYSKEIYKEIADRIQGILDDFKIKFSNLLYKFPSNTSLYFLLISLAIVIFIPTFLLLPVYKITETGAYEILGTNLIIAAIVYAVFMLTGTLWWAWYKRKYRQYVSELRIKIEGIFEEYREKVEKLDKEVLESYNLRVVYKKNIDILRKKLDEYVDSDVILQKKKQEVSSILDMGVLKIVDENKMAATKFDKRDDFWRIIEFEVFNNKNNNDELD